MQAEQSVVDVAEAPDEVVEEDGAEDEVKDAVPYHLLRGRDDVAALGAAPRDRVEHGDEGDEACAAHVAGAYAQPCIERCARAMAEEDGPIVMMSVTEKGGMYQIAHQMYMSAATPRVKKPHL